LILEATASVASARTIKKDPSEGVSKIVYNKISYLPVVHQ
jgi:hypothetical protein